MKTIIILVSIVVLLIWLIFGIIGAIIAMNKKHWRIVDLPRDYGDYDEIATYVLGAVCGIISFVIAIKLPYSRRGDRGKG